MKTINKQILDNHHSIKNIDTGNVHDSIKLFSNQVTQALEETGRLRFPFLKDKINNVVVVGMGGSAFASEIVKTLFYNEISVPYEIVREYHLPGYVNNYSLVIVSSYSATTKEAIACFYEALEKKSMLAAIFSDRRQNELYKLAVGKKIFSYIFQENFNPSLQPRLGVGYMVAGHIGILIKAGLLKQTYSDIKTAIDDAVKYCCFSVDVNTQQNLAKQLALKLYGKFPILVSSEFLQGAIHGFANQLNETSKTQSAYHFIPEINHHRMEGLEFPQQFKQLGIFILYPSPLYDQRIQARYELTKKVIEASGFPVVEFIPRSRSKISQVFETIIFNSYVSFYLAMLYRKNPVEIPWVDKFKQKMAAFEK